MADHLLHIFNFILGMLVLMGSPFFTRFFLRKLLDTESHPIAVLYFLATGLSALAYAELGLIVYRFVVTHA